MKAHLLNSYRKALAAILKCQLVPIRSRQGGRQAFEAFAADDDMHALGEYLGGKPLAVLTSALDRAFIGSPLSKGE